MHQQMQNEMLPGEQLGGFTRFPPFRFSFQCTFALNNKTDHINIEPIIRLVKRSTSSSKHVTTRFFQSDDVQTHRRVNVALHRLFVTLIRRCVAASPRHQIKQKRKLNSKKCFRCNSESVPEAGTAPKYRSRRDASI